MKKKFGRGFRISMAANMPGFFAVFDRALI
jgi:hypothetical protein